MLFEIQNLSFKKMLLKMSSDTLDLADPSTSAGMGLLPDT